MAIPRLLGEKFTPEQKDQLLNALQVISDILGTLPPVVLTPQERQKMNGVSERRFFYVQKTFNDLSVNYPDMRPPYSYEASVKNFEMMQMLQQMSPLLHAIYERFNDYSLASQHVAYKFVLDFYYQCKRPPVNEVVAEALLPLFRRPKQSTQ